MNETATLPIWVLIVFCIALIGFITLIYSRGNWRTTLTFVGLATIVVLTISGIEAWSDFIKIHFIGQFDQLGIPFREAGPGWTLLPATWPLWLVPAGIFALVAVGAGWWLNQQLTQKVITPIVTTPPEVIAPAAPMAAHAANSPPLPTASLSMQRNLTHKLEMESLKQELNSTKEKLETAIEIAEEQVDKNQDLEIQIAQLEEEHEETISDLQDRITALELELSSKETQNNELTTLALQQAEELAKLKEQEENS